MRGRILGSFIILSIWLTPRKVKPTEQPTLVSKVASAKTKPEISSLCEEVLDDLSKLNNVKIDPNTVVAIALIVDKLLDRKLGEQTAHIDTSLSEQITVLSEKYENLKTKTLPALATHVATVTNQLALRNLELETHRRKWNLILHGVGGEEGESQNTTREKVLRFAKDNLKLKNNELDMHFAACHRLSRNKDAGIIIRFCDLGQRDLWMSSTRNLKGSKFSLAPDLPPKVRPLKNAIMLHRKSLNEEARRKSKVRYLAQWPFVELRLDDKNTFRPQVALEQIVGDVLGIHTMFKLAME